jgi:hypothetical protein
MEDQTTGSIPKLEYIEWGLADFVDDTIFINKNLKKKKWDRLRTRVIEHEMQHKPGPYTTDDYKNDFKKSNLDLDVIYFLFENKKAIAQFSPIRVYPSKSKLYFDRQLIMLYGGIFFTIILTWILL